MDGARWTCRARRVIRDHRRIKAAVNYDPQNAIGLDGALSKVSQYSYAPVLLGVVAAGLIGFALYSMADARYRKI